MLSTTIVFFFKIFSFLIVIHSDTTLLAQLVGFLVVKALSILWLLCPCPDNFILLILNSLLLLVKFKCSNAIFLEAINAFQYVISSHFEKESIYNYFVQYNKTILYNKTVENLYGVTIDSSNMPDAFHLYCIDYLKISYTDIESTNSSQFVQKLKFSIESPVEVSNCSKNLLWGTIIILAVFSIKHLANLFLGNS